MLGTVRCERVWPSFGQVGRRPPACKYKAGSLGGRKQSLLVSFGKAMVRRPFAFVIWENNQVGVLPIAKRTQAELK